jgi:hypothetical protein
MGANELRTASGPRCAGAGAGDGAGGSAVVGLDSDAGLIAAAVPSQPLPPESGCCGQGLAHYC